MESKIIKTTKTRLLMNRKEALWLRGVMQNPINIKEDELEQTEDACMRAKFFGAVEGVK